MKSQKNKTSDNNHSDIKKELSIVIPVYNESGNLLELYERILMGKGNKSKHRL